MTALFAPGLASGSEQPGTGTRVGVASGQGANSSGPYDQTSTGATPGNGNASGHAVGEPCAGCVGKADNKNPPGQMPNGSDANAGYECDRNAGIGQQNPAHTGCLPTNGSTPASSTPPQSSTTPGSTPPGSSGSSGTLGSPSGPGNGSGSSGVSGVAAGPHGGQQIGNRAALSSTGNSAGLLALVALALLGIGGLALTLGRARRVVPRH